MNEKTNKRVALFDVKPETLQNVAASVQERNPDSILALVPLSGNISVHSPATKGKHKGYHRFKFEAWIPEDAIKGPDALTDFGAFVLMRLPQNRIANHLLWEKEDSEN